MAAIESIGLSDAQISAAVGSGTVILLLFFTFIFLGIESFTENSTFGSVVNSGFAMGGGGATAAVGEGADVDQDDPSLVDSLTEKVEEAMEMLNPA